MKTEAVFKQCYLFTSLSCLTNHHTGQLPQNIFLNNEMFSGLFGRRLIILIKL